MTVLGLSQSRDCAAPVRTISRVGAGLCCAVEEHPGWEGADAAPGCGFPGVFVGHEMH